MYSYQILSELGNLGLAFADTRLVASDGASVRVHWPLLLARGVWWTAAACADQEHDGDRVIIFSNVTISELRQFVSSIYCEYPCCGWSSFDIPLKTEAESEDDDIECEYTVHWGAGHQGPAEAGTVPLGLVAAPAPALCRGQDSSAHRGGRHPVLGQFCSGLGGWSLPRDGGRSG